MNIGDKRGQNLTLGTIILILLGVAVLVVLIFGFTTGWNNLWDTITGYSGSNNVDTIQQACALACSTQKQYDFCTLDRTIKFGSDVSFSGGNESDELLGTCQTFSDEDVTGVSACPSLC